MQGRNRAAPEEIIGRRTLYPYIEPGK